MGKSNDSSIFSKLKFLVVFPDESVPITLSVFDTDVSRL